MGKKIGLEAIRNCGRKEAMEFFHSKERAKRVVLAEEIKDERMHAIVLVSPSSTGRTTYIEKNFPGFKIINVEKFIVHDNDYEYQRLLQEFESCYNAGRNIAVEGNVFDIGVRSFILNALYDMGYTTHICMFGYNAIKRRFSKVCLAKAKDLLKSQSFHLLYEDQIEYVRVISNLSKIFMRDAASELDENFKIQYNHDMFTLGCESYEVVKTVV